MQKCTLKILLLLDSFSPRNSESGYGIVLQSLLAFFELFAKELANQLGFSILALAKKQKYTVSQLKLRRAQRAKNLQSVFVPSHLEALSRDATVLFVDDVTTTGSTLLEIA
ncbi:MAG: hypothetical protein LBU27_06005, partial [Candidatus Peribacteria bacterium]|nr:hypothetical protein [Candidatus Peribacteria bacterium]